MPVYDFDHPARFVAGTVGPPGMRTFFLQARDERRLISVSCEKEQLAAVAERLVELLDELSGGPGGPGGAASEASAASYADDGPLETPIEDEFRVTTMSLGWDDERGVVLIEATRRAGGPAGRCRRAHGRSRMPRPPRIVAGHPVAGAGAGLRPAHPGPRVGRAASLPLLRWAVGPHRARLPPRERLPALTSAGRARHTRRMGATTARATRPAGLLAANGSPQARWRSSDGSPTPPTSPCSLPCMRLPRWGSRPLRQPVPTPATPSTNRCAANAHCGISPAALWPAARSPRRCSPKPWGMPWCRRPCCGWGLWAPARYNCGSVTRSGSRRSPHRCVWRRWGRWGRDGSPSSTANCPTARRRPSSTRMPTTCATRRSWMPCSTTPIARAVTWCATGPARSGASTTASPCTATRNCARCCGGGPGSRCARATSTHSPT